MVMEVVEAVQEVTLERAGRAEGCFSLPFFAPLGLQVCCPHTYTDFTLRGCIAFPSQRPPPQDTEKDPLPPSPCSSTSRHQLARNQSSLWSRCPVG